MLNHCDLGLYSIFFFLVVPQRMQDLDSLTRDRTNAPCNGITEPPNHSTAKEFPGLTLSLTLTNFTLTNPVVSDDLAI